MNKKTFFCCILLIIPSSFIFGCATVTKIALGSVIEASTSGKEYEPKKVIVHEKSGYLIVLKKYQIDGDTIYGHKEDFSEYKIVSSEVIKIENFSANKIMSMDTIKNIKYAKIQRNIEDNQKNDEHKRHERAKNFGLFSICLLSGMILGTGVGTAFPLVEISSSSTPGAEQFLSMMSGMFIGGMIGILVYFSIKK